MNEIRIFGEIGWEVTAQGVRYALDAAGEDADIVVRIDSPGGSVFEGFSIFTALQKHKGRKVAVIESAAFSIASYIAMACDEIEIASNGYFMLHNPSVMAEGDDEAMAKQSTLLAKLKSSMIEAYCNRTGMTAEQVSSILSEETFFDANESVQFGLADRITVEAKASRINASVATKALPQSIAASLFQAAPCGDTSTPTEKPMADQTPVAATIQEIKSAFPKAKSDFIIRCLERSLPMASVAAAAAEEMMAENEELMAKVAALEAELAKAAELTIETEEEEQEPMDSEEETMEAVKAKSGVRPIAKRSSSLPSAKAQWDNAVEECLTKCRGDRAKAVAMANKQNPGLRQEMLAEING